MKWYKYGSATSCVTSRVLTFRDAAEHARYARAMQDIVIVVVTIAVVHGVVRFIRVLTISERNNEMVKMVS